MSPNMTENESLYHRQTSTPSYSSYTEEHSVFETIDLADANILEIDRDSLEPHAKDFLLHRKHGRTLKTRQHRGDFSNDYAESDSSHSKPSTSTTQTSSCSDYRSSIPSKYKRRDSMGDNVPTDHYPSEVKSDQRIEENEENDDLLTSLPIEKSPSLLNRISSFASNFSCTSSTYQESMVSDEIEMRSSKNHKMEQLMRKMGKYPYSRTLSNPKLIPKNTKSNTRKRSLRNATAVPPATTRFPPQYTPDHDNANSFDAGDLPTTKEIPPLLKVPYVHGGYAAVAPVMLQDPKWMNILRRLMPHSHREIVYKMYVGRTSDEPEFDFTPVKIMRWAENNPVVAAYGVLKGVHRMKRLQKKVSASQVPRQRKNDHRNRSLIQMVYDNGLNGSADSDPRHFYHKHDYGKKSGKGSHSIPNPARTPLEWDVFLDPTLVQKVDKAMQAVKTFHETNIGDPVARMALEVEVDRQVTRLLERMLLAHGSVSQLAAEAIGMSPKLNFSRMTRSVPLSQPGKSVGGNGLFLPVWLSLFSAALKLGSDLDIVVDNDYDEHSDTETEIGTSVSVDDRYAVTRGLAYHQRKQDSSGEHILDPRRSVLDSPKQLRTQFSGIPQSHSSQYYSNIQLQDSDLNNPPSLCGLFLCLGMDDPNSNRTNASCNMVSSLQSIYEVMGSNLKVILDLKSRRVPARVWGRLVDHLRARGISVEGIGSFDIPELRAIGSCCSSHLTQIIFFHSAGDLQRAVHAKELENGDTVYFNAGSLMWQKPSLKEATSVTCCGSSDLLDGKFMVKPFAEAKSLGHDRHDINIISTVEDYQRHLNLNIGVYVQEFSICAEALSTIIKLINNNSHVYNQGLAWGGLNGLSVAEIAGDGFWNQRFMGKNWDTTTGPTDKLTLHPEDYKIVRDALMVDVWGQVGTANDVQEISDRIQAGPCAPGVFVKIAKK